MVKPVETCSHTSSVCSTVSDFSGGYGLKFYDYFAGDRSAGRGGAEYYCPKVGGHYATCPDACKGESKPDECLQCCQACCKSGAVKSRGFEEKDRALAAFLRAILDDQDDDRRR